MYCVQGQENTQGIPQATHAQTCGRHKKPRPSASVVLLHPLQPYKFKSIMATNFQEKDAEIASLPLKAEINQEDGGIAFHFKLPASGLALRSVAIVDGVAELRFDSSPKVPTINEEDIATGFRLAVEGERPEFLYILIPPWHPFFGRQFKHYSPAWLRGTSVGDLLAEADWNMKCLHVGAKSNQTKSEFWSWQKKSHLDGLATRLDFPQDKPPGSVMMSCKSATVQKAENEMVFSEEPKMTIPAHFTPSISLRYTRAWLITMNRFFSRCKS